MYSLGELKCTLQSSKVNVSFFGKDYCIQFIALPSSQTFSGQTTDQQAMYRLIGVSLKNRLIVFNFSTFTNHP
jgi:hypothetical protein